MATPYARPRSRLPQGGGHLIPNPMCSMPKQWVRGEVSSTLSDWPPIATAGYGCVLTQRQLSGVYRATPPHRHNGHSLSARQQWQSTTYKYAGRQATLGLLGMRQQTASPMPKQKHPASLTAWPRNRQHLGYVQSLSPCSTMPGRDQRLTQMSAWYRQWELPY
jgi:hypothetical protein